MPLVALGDRGDGQGVAVGVGVVGQHVDARLAGRMSSVDGGGVVDGGRGVVVGAGDGDGDGGDVAGEPGAVGDGVGEGVGAGEVRGRGCR